MLKRIRGLDLARSAFVLSCGSIIFGYGYAVGLYQIFPFSVLQFGQNSVAQVSRELQTLLGIRSLGHVGPARYDGDGVTRFVSDRATPGLTFMSGFFEGGTELRLIRLDGSIENRWPVSHSVLFPDPQHLRSEEVPQRDWNVQIQGALALPDGSVVFNFEYLGMVKLDRCGATEWTVPRRTHHSIEPSLDGGFWVPGRRHVSEDNPAFLPRRAPYFEDMLLKIGENGDVQREMSVVEPLFTKTRPTVGASSRQGTTTIMCSVSPRSLAYRFGSGMSLG